MSLPSSAFSIGLIQDHATDDAAANLARTERLVREAAGRGAQIICLKELFNAPYFCKSQQTERFDLAETIPGPTTEAMTRLARELAVVLVVISQIKINVTNAYSGSLAWTNSFTRVTKHYPGRLVFLGVNLLIALVLMEANMFDFLNTILGFYANCGMAWVVVVVPVWAAAAWSIASRPTASPPTATTSPPAPAPRTNDRRSAFLPGGDEVRSS